MISPGGLSKGNRCPATLLLAMNEVPATINIMTEPSRPETRIVQLHLKGVSVTGSYRRRSTENPRD